MPGLLENINVRFFNRNQEGRYVEYFKVFLFDNSKKINLLNDYIMFLFKFPHKESHFCQCVPSLWIICSEEKMSTHAWSSSSHSGQQVFISSNDLKEYCG